MIKVFISYSHDSDEHREWVLGLSERLRKDGITTILDQYAIQDGSPPEGWPNWMSNSMDEATRVLCICTETYYRRFHGHEIPGKGKGVGWEGGIITQDLYSQYNISNKFIAVLRKLDDESYIPKPLRSRTHYVLNIDYQALYDALLGQGGVEPGEVGEIKIKPRKTGKSLIFDEESQSSALEEDHFLYYLGNLNQIKQQDHFFHALSLEVSCLQNGEARGFIIAGSGQELPRVLVFTLAQLLEGLLPDAPKIVNMNEKKGKRIVWKIFKNKPEDFLLQFLYADAGNKQAIKSSDDIKNQIREQFEYERDCNIFYREIPDDEAQDHDFLSRTLKAWSTLFSRDTKTMDCFLLLVFDTDLLGDDKAIIEQWRVRMEESLKQHDLPSTLLLPPQTSPTINKDLARWMIDWNLGLSFERKIKNELNGSKEMPLAELESKLFPIVKDHPSFKKKGQL